MFQPFPCKQTKKISLPTRTTSPKRKGSQTRGLWSPRLLPCWCERSIWHAGGGVKRVKSKEGRDWWRVQMAGSGECFFFFFWGFKKKMGFTMFYLKIFWNQMSRQFRAIKKGLRRIQQGFNRCLFFFSHIIMRLKKNDLPTHPKVMTLGTPKMVIYTKKGCVNFK